MSELLRRAVRRIPGMQAVFCAMLFLAFAIAPAAVMANSESPVGSKMHSGCDGYHSPQDDTDLRHCGMSVCHPGMVVMSETVPCSKRRYAHDDGRFPEGAGVLPELELPPPRSMV